MFFLVQEKIEWKYNDYKISALLHQFQKLKKLSKKNHAYAEDLKYGNNTIKDVSDMDLPISVSSKQLLTPHFAEFNIEDEISKEDESDEGWGKNVNNVDGVDDNDNKENESFKDEQGFNLDY